MALSQGSQRGHQSLRALKLLVAIMGLAIIASLVVIVVTVANRVAGPAAVREGFGELALPLPAGCSIAGAEADGRRLILRLEGLVERGCQQVVLVDLETGRVLGRVVAAPQP